MHERTHENGISQREIEFRRMTSSGMPMGFVSSEDFPTPESRVGYFKQEAERFGNAVDALQNTESITGVIRMIRGGLLPLSLKGKIRVNPEEEVAHLPVNMKDLFPSIPEELDRKLDQKDLVWLLPFSSLASLRAIVAEDAMEKIRLMREFGVTSLSELNRLIYRR